MSDLARVLGRPWTRQIGTLPMELTVFRGDGHLSSMGNE